MLAVYDSIQFNNADNNNTVPHNNSTLNQKKYQCTECEKGFSRPSALQTHMYTHTKEKPFKCDVRGCERSFSVVSNLRRHFKVHRKHNHGDKLSPEDRMRCVRRHIREVEALLAQTLPTTNYQNDIDYSSSSSSSSSSVSSVSSKSDENTGKRLYFLDEPIHDDFDVPLLSPILYIDTPPTNSFKADVLEPCSIL